MRPVFAQQSVRENGRTGRTPQEVLDDAMWGVFQTGWHQGFGADADHLKSITDIDWYAEAGYSFFTIDPGDYVDDDAAGAVPDRLRVGVEQLPWEVLESTPDDTLQRLADRTINLVDRSIMLSREAIFRAAMKYGKAIAHTLNMYRHLREVMGDRPFDLEVSVDETESVTTLAEHVYIASELSRLGVSWDSLAPRYLGRFEKGVDFQGDIQAFRESFSGHMAVARTFGPYKLSLHSGSDKFAIYPIIAELAGELVHVKTAGTSYLEALRTLAQLNPACFREVVDFAIDRFPQDRATYHVSARIEAMPEVATMPDTDVATLLDNFHMRQILHVTFGSVLNDPRLRQPLMEVLQEREEVYYEMLERHFVRHLQPFIIPR